jgi:catechol 2,3-dioxygenase-like lactoylglutathione lyase family enzyme
MEPRVSLITLGVADLNRSRAFYEALGFKPSSVGGGEVFFFQAGDVVLTVWSRAELAKDAGVEDSGSGFRGSAIAHNVRAKHEVGAVLREAAAAGAEITRPAHDADWGGRSGYFADPDGHLWEVAWNPGFPISEDGKLTIPP